MICDDVKRADERKMRSHTLITIVLYPVMNEKAGGTRCIAPCGLNCSSNPNGRSPVLAPKNFSFISCALYIIRRCLYLRGRVFTRARYKKGSRAVASGARSQPVLGICIRWPRKPLTATLRNIPLFFKYIQIKSKNKNAPFFCGVRFCSSLGYSLSSTHDPRKGINFISLNSFKLIYRLECVVQQRQSDGQMTLCGQQTPCG